MLAARLGAERLRSVPVADYAGSESGLLGKYEFTGHGATRRDRTGK